MEQLDGDRVVHLPAGARVRVQDQGDRRIFDLARRVAPLDAAGCAGQNHLWHVASLRWSPNS